MFTSPKDLPEYLNEEYSYWEKQLSEFDKMQFRDCVSTQEVLKGYYILTDYFHSKGEKLNYGIKDFYLIGSAVGRQFTEWNGKKKWINKCDIAATLFFGLNKNHAFSDGNKRTSLLILLYFLIKNQFIFQSSGKKSVQREFEQLAVKTAENSLSDYPCYEKYKDEEDAEVKTIAAIIKKHIRKTDKAYVTMTFQEFFTKLEKYGFTYEILVGNKVDIYKSKRFLFTSEKKYIGQYGCPGLKKQINPKCAKEILKACGFSYENGFDYQSFIQGNESMYKLIDEFEAPLRRLKDK